MTLIKYCGWQIKFTKKFIFRNSKSRYKRWTPLGKTKLMLNKFATPLSRLYSACCARQGSFLPASKWCPFKSITFQNVIIQNGELTVQKFPNVGSKSLIHDDMPKRDPPTLYPTDVTTMIVKSAILFWSRLWHRNSPMLITGNCDFIICRNQGCLLSLILLSYQTRTLPSAARFAACLLYFVPM